MSTLVLSITLMQEIKAWQATAGKMSMTCQSQRLVQLRPGYMCRATSYECVGHSNQISKEDIGQGVTNCCHWALILTVTHPVCRTYLLFSLFLLFFPFPSLSSFSMSSINIKLLLSMVVSVQFFEKDKSLEPLDTLAANSKTIKEREIQENGIS